MKKILFVFLALVLLAPLMLYGCANNNTVENGKYVEYQFITYQRTSTLAYEYIFQLRVRNKTDEDFDIIKSNFNMVYDYNNLSYYFNDFALYEDEACTSEITLSRPLAAGQTKELYVKTTSYINANATNVYLRYNGQYLVQIRLSNNTIVRQNSVRA